MNFQEVRNLEGQKDGKGYQKGVDFQGLIVSIEEKKFNDKGKPFQQVTIKDGPGETQKVKIYLGNGPDILPTDVNTLQAFTVSPNSYQNQMYYMGFWDSTHPPQGQQQPVQQQGNQAHAAPIQQAMAGAGVQYQQPEQAVDTSYVQQPAQTGDDKARGMVRHGLIVAILGNSAIDSSSPATVKSMAQEYVEYIMTGSMAEAEPNLEDQIPFGG